MTSTHDRWNEHQPIDLRQLLLNSDYCTSPFGLTKEGLCDFRGICVNVSLHDITVENMDFTQGELRRGQFMGLFRHCKFEDFKCDGNLGENFEDCIFHKASLSNSIFYGKFVNCDFSNANLIGVRGRHIKFEGCIFKNANLRKASFYDSKFSKCKFVNCTITSGSLAGSIFDECEVHDIDLSKTVLERVKGLEQVR